MQERATNKRVRLAGAVEMSDVLWGIGWTLDTGTSAQWALTSS